MEKEILKPVKISKSKSTKKDTNNIGAKLYFSKNFLTYSNLIKNMLTL